MISRVLVPMDGSDMSERALEYALEVHSEADVTVLYVAGEPSPFMGEAARFALDDDLESIAEERAETVFDRAREIAASRDAEIDTAVAVGHPARAIVSRAENFDAVVIGSHGGSLTDRLFVGDVAKTVFRRSPVPVTVVR